ncbi:MAG: acyl-CoA dehydrogenase family protein [Nocardioidaceae bacterium]
MRDGEDYVVTGQKTWTTLAQHADWIFVLVRTDPDAPKKQQGISFLLIDMATPGVSVRPIELIDGGHEVNEVFFDQVRVPAANLVGQENQRMGLREVPARQRTRRCRAHRSDQSLAGAGQVVRRRLGWPTAPPCWTTRS